MLTRLRIRNFKRFGEVDIELGNPVVFIGPNNSGKTTALQALALWEVGLRKWIGKHSFNRPSSKRPGVTINRRDLIAMPVPDANLLWRDLHVREVRRNDRRPTTKNIRIDVIVDGVTDGKQWVCGLEFDYANQESFYVRPLGTSEHGSPRLEVPPEVAQVFMAFLPPMSGLAATETRLDSGAINVRLGEGRTAEVLRNLCFQVFMRDEIERKTNWRAITDQIKTLFGVALEEPQYIADRGEVVMTYRDEKKTRLDLSASGRGLQQTLLLLAHMTANPNSVLLLDEPDAHLEILRQRETYQLLSELARAHNCQIIAASHSEVVLNEAAGRDVVIAFVGKPHRIDDRGSQVLKSLKNIGFEQYYQAEQKGWILYLEGSRDLAILQVFAETLGHPARDHLERTFVHYVQNIISRAQDHFFGLLEAKPDLVGYALFDHLPNIKFPKSTPLSYGMWQKREIESYLCIPEALHAWANDFTRAPTEVPLFAKRWQSQMRDSIAAVESAMATLGKGSPWEPTTKVSEDFLDPLFEHFFGALKLPNLMRKTDYHQIARHVPADKLAPEVKEVLDEIVAVAEKAKPNE
jgi:predicted ATPase